MRVPLNDLSQSLRGHEEVLRSIVNDGRFVGGSVVEGFEAAWASRTSARACVGTSSGTAALTAILREARRRTARRTVVVPGISFVATAEAVRSAGMRPYVVDVGWNGLMDGESLMRGLEEMGDGVEDVAAVVPVHLYGQVVDVATIESVCQFLEIPVVVEDACQAHGASYAGGAGRPVGSRNPTAWSFMPAKILGAWGDAGAVTAPEGWEEVREHVDHGRAGHNLHRCPGDNARLDAIQAAVLTRKLSKMDAYRFARRRIAGEYEDRLPDELGRQEERRGRSWSYYTVRTPLRDSFVDWMRAGGVEVGSHYPYTLADAFTDWRPRSASLPIAVTIANETATLPLWPHMAEDQVEHVCDRAREFFA